MNTRYIYGKVPTFNKFIWWVSTTSRTSAKVLLFYDCYDGWFVEWLAIRWDDVLFDNVTKKEGRAT